MKETITLADIAEISKMFTKDVSLRSGEIVRFRPLETTDEKELAVFLEKLSPQTREFSTFSSYDITAASEMCAAIARYDKLRFVVTSNKLDAESIIALMEFSFDIPEADHTRYLSQGFKLNDDTDCRFGPTISDEYQNLGLGSLLLPILTEVANSFGQERIILWGGVLTHNRRAIHYYEKNNFRKVGEFTEPEGRQSFDMILELSSESV